MDHLFPRDDRERLEFKESALQMGFEELTTECTASLNLLQSHDRLSVLIMAWRRIGEYLKHNQYSPSVSTVVNWVGRHTLELWFGRDWISCPTDNKSILIDFMMKVYPAAYISMCPYSWPYMFTIFRDPWMVDYLNENFQRMNDLELSEHLDSKDSDFILEEGLSLIFLRIVNMFDFNMMKLVRHMCRRLLLAWHDTSSIAHRSLRVALNAPKYIEYVRHMYLITFNEINGIKDLHYVLECVQRNMHCNAIEFSHLDRAAQIIAEGLMECKQTLMEFLITFLSIVPDRQFNNTFGIAVNKYKAFLTEYLLKMFHTRRPVGYIGHMPVIGIYEILVKMFIENRESSEDLMKTTAAVSERLFAGVHDLRALKFSYDQIKSLTRAEWYTIKVSLLLGIISEELNILEVCKYTEGQTADELIRREQNLAIYYRDLSRLLGRTPALEQEAWLTTFSLHPCKEYFDAVTKCGNRNLRAIKKQAIKLKIISEPKQFKATNNQADDSLSPDGEKSSQNQVEDLSIAIESEEFPPQCTVLAIPEPNCSYKIDTLTTNKTITGKSKRPLLSKKVTKTITKPRPKSKSLEKQTVGRVTTPIPKKSLNDCRDRDTAEVLYAASAGAGNNVALQTEETIKYPEFALVNSVTDTEDVVRYTDYEGDVLAQYHELERLLSNIRLPDSNSDDLLALLIAPRYKRLTWATSWKNLKKRCRSLLTKDNKKKQLVEQYLADANERLTHLQIDYDKYKNKPQIDYGTIEGGYECFDTESVEEGGLRKVVAGLKRIIKRTSHTRRTIHFEEDDLSDSQLASESLESTTRIEEEQFEVFVDSQPSTLETAPSDDAVENSIDVSACINVNPNAPSDQAAPLQEVLASRVQASSNAQVETSVQVASIASADQSAPNSQALPIVHSSPSIEALGDIPPIPSVQTFDSEVEKNSSETFLVHIPKVPLKTYSRHRVAPSEKIAKLIPATDPAAGKSHEESTSKATCTDEETEKTFGTGALTNSSKAATSQGESSSTEPLKENQQTSKHKSAQTSKDMADQWGNISYPVDNPNHMDYEYEDPSQPQHYPPSHLQPCMHQINQMEHSMAPTDTHPWNLYLPHQQMSTANQQGHVWTETVNIPSIPHLSNQIITATDLSPLTVGTCPHAQQPSTSYFDPQCHIASGSGTQVQPMYMSDNAMTGMYNHPHGARYFQYDQNREHQYDDQMVNIPNIPQHPHTFQPMEGTSSFTNPHCLHPTYDIRPQLEQPYYMDPSMSSPSYQEEYGIPRSSSQESLSDWSSEPVLCNIQERTMSACAVIQQDYNMSDSEFISFAGNEEDAKIFRPRARAKSSPPHCPSEKSQSSIRSCDNVREAGTSINSNPPQTSASRSSAKSRNKRKKRRESTSSDETTENVALIDLRENVEDGSMFKTVQSSENNEKNILNAPRPSTFYYFVPELNTVQIVKPSGTTRIAKMIAGMGQGIRRIIPNERLDMLKIKPVNKLPNPRWRTFYSSIFKRKIIYVPTETEVEVILQEYCGQRLNGRSITRINICGLTEDHPGEEILDESVVINLTNPRFTNGRDCTNIVSSSITTDRVLQNNPTKPELPDREAGVLYKIDEKRKVHFFLGIPTPAYHLSIICPYDRNFRRTKMNKGKAVYTIERDMVYKMYMFLKDDDFAWQKFPLLHLPSPQNHEDDDDDEFDYVRVEGDEEKSDATNQCHNESQRHIEAVSLRNPVPPVSGINQSVNPIEISSDSDESPEKGDMIKSTITAQQSHCQKPQMSGMKPYPEQQRKLKVCLGSQRQIQYSMQMIASQRTPQPRKKLTRKLVVRLERYPRPSIPATDVSNTSDNRTSGKRYEEDSESDTEISLRRSGRYAQKVYGAGPRTRIMENTAPSSNCECSMATSYPNQQQIGYPDRRGLNVLSNNSVIDSELLSMPSIPTFEEISSDE